MQVPLGVKLRVKIPSLYHALCKCFCLRSIPMFSVSSFPTICYTFFLSLSTSSLNDAHPLAVKLNKLIEDGKIPESCIYYKFLNDTMSFALTDPKTTSAFKWDDEVCEFFLTIKYLEGERTRKFVRGPGFFRTGRGREK